jgi:uncharacterized protein
MVLPGDAWCVFVYAHGAGAGWDHGFMEATASRLAAAGVATFRYNFPYMEQGGWPPDRPKKLIDTVSAGVAAARELSGGLPMFAGGKSLGGRMTSNAAAQGLLPGVEGLIFFGFPLHTAGKPGVERAQHLHDVKTPMLFLQGTRDRLARLDLIRATCERLGSQSTLHVVEEADHGFQVLKRSPRSNDDILDELVSATVSFCRALTEGL